MNLFERSVEKWKEVYLYGQKIRINRGMAYGKQMAEGLEYGEATGDDVLDMIIEKLPKFEIMDKPVECELKTGRGQEPILILIKPDTMKADMTAFKEYKTGQQHWNKYKVDNFGQITFYATGLFLKTGKIPTDIELVHIQTAKLGNGSLDANIGATGAILRYPTERNMSQVINMMVKMKKVWNGIQKICKEEFF